MAKAPTPRKLTSPQHEPVQAPSGSWPVERSKPVDGKDYFRVRSGTEWTQWLPCVGADRDALIYSLQNADLHVGRKEADELLEKLEDAIVVTAHVAHGPGWQKNKCYVQANLQTKARLVGERPVVTFTDRFGKFRKRGTRKGWRGVYSRHGKARYLDTAVMSVLAAPVLDIIGEPPITVEIIDAAAAARSGEYVKRVVASIQGSPNPVGNSQWFSCADALSRPHEVVWSAKDAALIIDNVGSLAATSTPSVRSANTKALAAILSGIGEADPRTGAATRTSLIVVLGTPAPVGSVVPDLNTILAPAHRSRMITLDVSEAVAEVYGGSAEARASQFDFSEKMLAGLDRHHGSPFDVMVERLATLRAEDAVGLKKRIGGYIADFRHAACRGSEDPQDQALGRLYGILYATGVLAKEFEILPATFDPQAAAQYCFEQQVLRSQRPLGTVIWLEEFAKRPDVIRLDEGVEIDDEAFASAAGFKKRVNGQHELLVRQAVAEAEPDWSLKVASLEAAGYLYRGAADRQLTKRRMGTKRPRESFYIFVRPKKNRA